MHQTFVSWVVYVLGNNQNTLHCKDNSKTIAYWVYNLHVVSYSQSIVKHNKNNTYDKIHVLCDPCIKYTNPSSSSCTNTQKGLVISLREQVLQTKDLFPLTETGKLPVHTVHKYMY